jgi:hypothetical protein
MCLGTSAVRIQERKQFVIMSPPETKLDYNGSVRIQEWKEIPSVTVTASFSLAKYITSDTLLLCYKHIYYFKISHI